MNEQIDKSISTVLDLPDDRFMLALCVRPENLQDPAKWCAAATNFVMTCG